MFESKIKTPSQYNHQKDCNNLFFFLNYILTFYLYLIVKYDYKQTI